MHDYPGYSPDASQSDYFEICLHLYIHMTLLKVTYSESAYLFTYNTLGTKSLVSFFFRPICLLDFIQQQIFI